MHQMGRDLRCGLRERFDRRLEEVAEAVGGTWCQKGGAWAQAGHPEGGGGGDTSCLSNASLGALGFGLGFGRWWWNQGSVQGFGAQTWPKSFSLCKNVVFPSRTRTQAGGGGGAEV